jgi:hypothetical protein
MGSIVELEDSDREKFENIVIFGLWLSKKKPEYQEYLKRVLDKLSIDINRQVLINGLQFYNFKCLKKFII